jgi:hypothetical protein
MNLNQFIGKSQIAVLEEAIKGEEGLHFSQMLLTLYDNILAIPKPYETEDQGDAAPVRLHYFKGGSDWYIIERDIDGDQIQCFGFACLNGDKQNAEFGYINIAELIKYGVELDLYYKPQTVEDIKRKYGKELNNAN